MAAQGFQTLDAFLGWKHLGPPRFNTVKLVGDTMRRRGSGLIFIPIAVVAFLLLAGGKGGTGLLNVNHSMLLRNPPQGVSTVITSPRGRQWNVDRRIHWPQPTPGLQPQYPQTRYPQTRYPQTVSRPRIPRPCNT